MAEFDKKLNMLEEKAQQLYGDQGVTKIKDAYAFARDAHKSQLRSSGDPYIIHPLEVALILIDMGLDVDTIVAGLLHDVVEDTGVPIEELSMLLERK